MTLGSAILDERADEVSGISVRAFRITSCVLFGVAILSVIARIWLKVYHRRKLHLDDYVLFFGTACLIAATGMLLYGLDAFYLGPVILSDTSLMPLAPPKLLEGLDLSFMYAMLSLTWTATFCAKFSLLAFFYDIVRSVQIVKRYYFVTIIFTFLSYCFIIVDPFIVCSKFGTESIPCFYNPNMKLIAALTYTGSVLDCVTDIMIVSIPIVILHRTRILHRQRVAVGAFLCLSIVMVAVSIVRSTKIHGPDGIPEDVPWMLFWPYCESAVAVLMVSLTAFRTVFKQKKEEESRRERLKQPPTYSQHRNSTRKLIKKVYIRHSGISVGRAESHYTEPPTPALPVIPTATLQGWWSFIKEQEAANEENTTQDTPALNGKITPLTSPTKSYYEKRSFESFV